MDVNSIFRQLTTGISFDKKKYPNEAQMFGLTKSQLSTKGDNDENERISIDEYKTNPNVNDDIDSSSNPDSIIDDDDFKLLSNEIKVKKNNEPKKKKKSNDKKLLLHQEKINQFRNIHKIHISGSDIPDPIDNWDKLSTEKYGFSERILDVIASKENGYSMPTPIQMQAIPLLLGMIQIFIYFCFKNIKIKYK